MKGLASIFFFLITIFPQSGEAQRSRGTSSRDTFIPLTPEQVENTVNLLGIELGQTLADTKNIIEGNGGEVLWQGSPDPTFVRTKAELERGNTSYFRYIIHSISNPNATKASQVSTGPYSREDIVLTVDVYPKTPGDLKDPENLVLYHVQTYLSYQPSDLQLRNINPIQVSFADFHSLMEKKGHFLYQSGGLLVYKKGIEPSITIGDLKANRSTWEKVLPTKFPCNELSTRADDFPKVVNGMMNSSRVADENGQNSKIIFQTWSELIDKYEGANAADTYKACGSATVIQVIQRESTENPDKPLLSSIRISYQNANLLDAALEGFYKAIYK